MPPVGWFESGSLSFEVVKALPSAVIPAVVALFVAGIALRQYNVARAKLNLDLFKDRYELYLLLWDALSLDFADDGEGDLKALQRLRGAVPRAYFLFDKAIGDYFEEVIRKGFEQRSAWRRLSHSGLESPNRQLIEGEIQTLEDWFSSEYGRLVDRFSKYMAFENWRR